MDTVEPVGGECEWDRERLDGPGRAGPQRPWKGAWILLRVTLCEGPWQAPRAYRKQVAGLERVQG